MTINLSFCGSCGVLISPEKSSEKNPKCDNCDMPLEERDSRAIGYFYEDDAKRLLTAVFGE